MKHIFLVSLIVPLLFNSCLHKKDSNPGSKKNILMIADEWPQMDVLVDRLNKFDSRMQTTSGWYKQTGKGRIFYYQAGHSVPDYEDQNFSRILLNTLEWTPEKPGNR